MEAMKDEFAIKIQDMQEEISKYKERLSEVLATENKLKATIEAARLEEVERQKRSDAEVASLQRQVETLQAQLKAAHESTSTAATVAPAASRQRSTSSAEPVLPSALDPSRNLAVKLDFDAVPLSYKNPALLAAASPDTANRVRARRGSVYESTVEYQLFNWMVLAIKLDFTTRTQLIDSFDKYQCVFYLPLPRLRFPVL